MAGVRVSTGQVPGEFPEKIKTTKK